ncbi:cytochrome subunit of sulfide dehydrogenase [Gallionellaceae bacterium]|nr:cytochrome subunit of sulfide dehydrogenase [Gallionellaceae bacterium]
MKKTTSAIYISGLLAFFAGAAQAAEDVGSRNLAAACAACHGTNGHAVTGMSALAGMDKAYMVKTMQEFKTGKRPATVMHQLAKGYSDDQIGQIAEFFAKQQK